LSGGQSGGGRFFRSLGEQSGVGGCGEGRGRGDAFTSNCVGRLELEAAGGRAEAEGTHSQVSGWTKWSWRLVGHERKGGKGHHSQCIVG